MRIMTRRTEPTGPREESQDMRENDEKEKPIVEAPWARRPESYHPDATRQSEI
jgi:hypothetical protein